MSTPAASSACCSHSISASGLVSGCFVIIAVSFTFSPDGSPAPGAFAVSPLFPPEPHPVSSMAVIKTSDVKTVTFLRISIPPYV